MASKLNDLTGRRFGRLTVIKQAPALKKEYENSTIYRTMWLCQCDCGKTVTIAGENMKRGITKSCGCLRSELSSKRLKDAYAALKSASEMGERNLAKLI